MIKIQHADLKSMGLSEQALAIYAVSDFTIYEDEDQELVLKIFDDFILKGDLQDIESSLSVFVEMVAGKE